MNRAGLVAILSPGRAPPPPRLLEFADRLRQGQGFETLVDAPGLLAIGDPKAAHLVLRHRTGILWGHVFDRATGRRITGDSASTIAPCSADAMLTRYWGGYFRICMDDRGIEVLRDPSGAVACYHAVIHGFHVVTSVPHLLVQDGLIEPAIDWTVVAQSLAFRDLRPAQTALRGIGEILPGISLQIGPDGGQPRTAWSPWTFAQAEAQILDPALAVESLREALARTLAAWSPCFERPLLEISGGLDSAIVAAGLRPGLIDPKCVTFGPQAGDASELPWAHAVADHLGLSLTELSPDSALVDLTQSDARDLPRPCARPFTQAMDRVLQRFARQDPADAFIGGGGGDSLFCFQYSARPVIDRYRDQGPGLGLLQTARDMARVARTDVWTVLLGAARLSLRPPSRMPKPQCNRFLSRAAKANLPWPAGHPWLEAPADTAPGKRNHVWSIIAMQNHVEGYGREAIAPYLAPLLSQPIFETCVRIPSWHWCIGGNNRAVARAAFRGTLPDAVLDRTTKLSFSDLARRILETNRDLLRAMIFDGAAAREGLVDLPRVEAFLDTGLVRDEALSELMALVEVEAWTRAWTSRSGRGR